jgi:hypothetical protein
MSPQEREYYRDRAASERLCAAEATNPRAAEIHLKLACLYKRLVELEEERPTLRLVSSNRLLA